MRSFEAENQGRMGAAAGRGAPYILALLLAPAIALAGPFATGATATQTQILTILTPVAVIAVMVLGTAAWFNKISWGWVVAAIGGIVLVFGAPQIVAWIRSLFGV